ncbi:LacI family DNA-binding transcriptional regulator [Ferruginibacter profundus]
MTIIEIAKKLGVSPSTVSRALNNSHQISKTTRNKVNEFVKEINFHRNPQATSLKRGSTKTIAVIIPEISNHFFTLALNAIEEIANRNKFHVLIYQTHENHDREVEIINELYNGRVDGVLISVAGSIDKDFSHIENLSNFIPVVFFDRVITKEGIPAITCNDYESGLKATEHLVKKGCSNIAFIGITDQISVTSARLAGYTEALKNNGLPVKKENILFCSNEKEAEEKIKNALVQIKPDGIFSTVERYTLLLYRLCNELKIAIPGNLKIISFFNSPTAALLAPPLSSIIHPATQMGAAAVEFLLQKLKHKKDDTEKNIIFDCTFHFRESSI